MRTPKNKSLSNPCGGVGNSLRAAKAATNGYSLLSTNVKSISGERLATLLSSKDELSTRELLDAAAYLDQLGETSQALNICVQVLSRVSAYGTDLERKAHNIVATLYASANDFDLSISHHAKALKLSLEMETIHRFAALCNISATLQTMGLLVPSCALSKKLLSFPSDSTQYKELHLQNAVIGGISSYHVGDAPCTVQFNQAAQQLSAELCISDLTHSYIDLLYVLSSLVQGRVGQGLAYAERKIQGLPAGTDFKIMCSLVVARAECVACLADRSLIDESVSALLALLPDSIVYPEHHERILRVLIKLQTLNNNTSEDREKGIQLVRQLSELVLNRKHGQFFDRVTNALNLSDGRDGHLTPSYELNILCAEIPEVQECCMEFESTTAFCLADAIQVKALEFCDPELKQFEVRLRSPKYNIAEDCAAAAEYRMGGDGSRGLRVGKVARFIAERAGYNRLEAVELELACRLYNTGCIAFSSSMHHAVLNGEIDEWAIRDYTSIGESLLGSAGNPLTQLGASVAKYHLAWWNGAGYPEGIGGVDIPIEARICAVAIETEKLYLGFPTNNVRKAEFVVRQLGAMAGVQLDSSFRQHGR